PGICDDLSIQTFEVVPTVLLLVDTSSSMFEQRAKLWDPLFNALMDPTAGVIAKLQDKVRFGFTSYKSITRPTGAATCPVLESTDLKLNNFDTIKAKYTEVGMTPTSDYKWETPTGASIAEVAKTLAAFTPDPPGPKFILLVTDGDPDTCAVRDPQCGQDDSIKAVQDAYAAGIGTFVIGIGDILTSSSTNMRGGVQHLQDVANAGTGQPVAPNSLEYTYSACIKDTGLTATYAADVMSGGTAPYYTVSATDATTAQAQLAAAIQTSLDQTRSCAFNMDAQVNGDASLGTLTVDGNPLTFGDPNGWSLGADLTSVTINGTACEAWKKNGGKLNVVFPCKLVPVIPKPVKPPT
ncbi:MAG TPA: vWA domain-containing protein, partial [Polyangiaceae bacterium]|nr:vWA domain-containing protein [Polyangiaceae bacterium]